MSSVKSIWCPTGPLPTVLLQGLQTWCSNSTESKEGAQKKCIRTCFALLWLPVPAFLILFISTLFFILALFSPLFWYSTFTWLFILEEETPSRLPIFHHWILRRLPQISQCFPRELFSCLSTPALSGRSKSTTFSSTGLLIYPVKRAECCMPVANY